MAVLIVLGVVLVLARIAGALGIKPLDSWPAAVRVGLAAMLLFTLAGTAVTPLAVRIPMQVLFIALTWWAGIRRAHD